VALIFFFDPSSMNSTVNKRTGHQFISRAGAKVSRFIRKDALVRRNRKKCKRIPTVEEKGLKTTPATPEASWKIIKEVSRMCKR
jgi:hypothetical protein